MDGLYVTPDRFLSFSELESGHSAKDKRLLSRELYSGGLTDGFDPAGWLELMPDPDPILTKTGDGVAVLRSLLADDKVISSVQNRKLGTLKKLDYVYEAGAEENGKPDGVSEKLCEDLSRDLKSINLYNVFSQVLDAPYFGSAFVEILWDQTDGRLRVADLKPRPVEWFGFDEWHQAIFKGKDGSNLDLVTDNKVVIARHFPDATNPYGLRLLSRCLWPVAIKKGGIQFWTTLCERFGMPWVIGQVDGDKKDRESALAQLTAMVQDAVAVVSSGTEVDIHSIAGQGGDLSHAKLIEYSDRCIARALQGQNLTNEGSSTGSYAESQTSADALDDYQDADEHMLVTFMNALSAIYHRVNSDQGLSPVFRFREPDDYQQQVDLDKGLYSVGVRFKPVHFVRRFRLSEDEFTMADDAGDTETNPSESDQSFADGSADPDDATITNNQAIIDGLITAIEDSGMSVMAGNEKKLISAILAASTYEEALLLLLEQYPSLSVSDLEDLMERGILNADLFGRYSATEDYTGSEGDDA